MEMLKKFYERFHPKIESAEASDERINEERNLGRDPETGKFTMEKKPVYHIVDEEKKKTA